MTIGSRDVKGLLYVLRKQFLLLLLVLICGIAYFMTSFWYVEQLAIAPTGDEPHYLVISQTLLRYHSLDVMQDYQHGDYLSFYPGHLDPHVTPNVHGQPLPVHGIGGPVLWLIPFALAGRFGAVLFMAFVTLLIIINIYKFLSMMGIHTIYAFLVSLAYALASPLYIYSHLNFIEPIAALFCLYVFRKILQREIRISEVIISAILLGLLPWVHIRFALLELALFLALLYKLYHRHGWSNFRYYVAYLVPTIILFFLFEFYNYKVWGSLNPAINQAGMLNQPFERKPTTGLIWLFFDQEYGIVPNFPLFFLFLTGILLSLQRKFVAHHLLVLVATVPYLLLISSLLSWEGGYTPPTRFLLVLLPMWSFYPAYALQRLNKVISALAIGCALLIGFAYNYLSLGNSFNRKLAQVVDLSHIIILHHPLSTLFPLAYSVPPQTRLFFLWVGAYLLFSLLLWGTWYAGTLLTHLDRKRVSNQAT